ncbi:uncharacterized protein CC84DRAFT_279958 [Paraphaeosphaeria sporulosa]|uniref:Uncharacterized protein n=1 Tax=Paraphaeosphaeria sporulosa TaxID=1460663 RepID=A0A177C2S7_9PLEO|nr:uncharacterized protein CC84DRAFT_279958 [Paraphaeosphaeria sporulosa]OAG01199.1 hypothetical protein CC84DRAFT_279958 [Paraphaeosphaeria sporulosa]
MAISRSQGCMARDSKALPQWRTELGHANKWDMASPARLHSRRREQVAVSGGGLAASSSPTGACQGREVELCLRRNSHTTCVSPKQPVIVVRYAQLGTRAAKVSCVPGSFAPANPRRSNLRSTPTFGTQACPTVASGYQDESCACPAAAVSPFVNSGRPGGACPAFHLDRELVKPRPLPFFSLLTSGQLLPRCLPCLELKASLPV